MKAKPIHPLTPLQRALLVALRANGRLTLRQCWSYSEALDPAASQSQVAARTAAALERLAKEQVIGLHFDPAAGLTGAEAIVNLPAEARACVLLAKPPLEPKRALPISRQPEHKPRGEALPNQSTPDSGGASPADNGAIYGARAIPDASGTGPSGTAGQSTGAQSAVSASEATPKTAPQDVLAGPGAPNSPEVDPEAPAVETVQIKDPEARP